VKTTASRSAWILLAVAVLVSGQTTKTTNKKATPPAPKPDTWERSKECAKQAEKVMADSDKHSPPYVTWENHYSPKYKRCFISILENAGVEGAGKDFARWRWHLSDAFERSWLAMSEWDGPTEPGACSIEGQETDCEKAKAFIREHMKN